MQTHRQHPLECLQTVFDCFSMVDRLHIAVNRNGLLWSVDVQYVCLWLIGFFWLYYRLYYACQFPIGVYDHISALLFSYEVLNDDKKREHKASRCEQALRPCPHIHEFIYNCFYSFSCTVYTKILPTWPHENAKCSVMHIKGTLNQQAAKSHFCWVLT